MPAKAAKSAKKSSKTPAPKKSKKIDFNPFKAHWTQDISLEIPFPATASFAPGQRELDFSAGVQHYPLQDESSTKIELRLRVYIHSQQTPLALAEMCYAGVVEKSQFAKDQQKMLENLYQLARPRLLQLLTDAGHQPPLPNQLNQ